MNKYMGDSDLLNKAKDIVRHDRSFLDQAISAIPCYWGHSEKKP